MLPTPRTLNPQGKLVGMDVEVIIADQKFKKAVAFKYGSRPFTSVVCAGLEEGVKGGSPHTRTGGIREALCKWGDDDDDDMGGG